VLGIEVGDGPHVDRLPANDRQLGHASQQHAIIVRLRQFVWHQPQHQTPSLGREAESVRIPSNATFSHIPCQATPWLDL